MDISLESLFSLSITLIAFQRLTLLVLEEDIWLLG